MSSVIVAKASVISCLQICNIWNWCPKHFVLNIPPHNKKSRGAISGDRGGQNVRPSLPIHLFGNVASKTNEHPNPSMEVHHLVGKLSTAETLLGGNIKFQHVQVVFL